MKQAAKSNVSIVIVVGIAAVLAIAVVVFAFIQQQPALLTGQISSAEGAAVGGAEILIYPAETCQPFVSAWIQGNAGKLHSKLTYGTTVADLRKALNGMSVSRTVTKENGEYSVTLPVSDYELIAEVTGDTKIFWVQYIHLQPGKNRLDFNQGNAATVLKADRERFFGLTAINKL